MMSVRRSSLLCFLVCVPLVELSTVKDDMRAVEGEVKDDMRADEGDLVSGSCVTEEGDECQFPFSFLDYESNRDDFGSGDTGSGDSGSGDSGDDYGSGDTGDYDSDMTGVNKTFDGCTNYEDVDKKLWCNNKDGEKKFCTKECPVDIDLECRTKMLPEEILGHSATCEADQEKYCQISKKNTMCKYCGVNMAACGKAVCMLAITNNTEIQEIVDRHNELRRKVANGTEKGGKVGGQPKAANMNKLTWDPEVARMAQVWANQCDDENPHDKNRNMAKGYEGYCGQNAYWAGHHPYYGHPQKKFLTTAVDAWYNEVKGFDNAAVDSYGKGDHDGKVGHYTQLIWADVTTIGCGYVQRWDGEYFSETIKCNYCPGGNWEDMAIYKVGEPGSQCPEGRKNDDGLCVLE